MGSKCDNWRATANRDKITRTAKQCGGVSGKRTDIEQHKVELFSFGNGIERSKCLDMHICFFRKSRQATNSQEIRRHKKNLNTRIVHKRYPRCKSLKKLQEAKNFIILSENREDRLFKWLRAPAPRDRFALRLSWEVCRGDQNRASVLSQEPHEWCSAFGQQNHR